MKNVRLLLLSSALVFLTACSTITPTAAVISGTATASPSPTSTATAELTLTATSLPSLTPTPEPTNTPSPTIPPSTPTPVLLMQGPGEITCPILLYHRIATPTLNVPYYVTPEEFRAQMQALKDWGYTPITATQLVKAISVGSMLPQRPVVISFDDGDNSVYFQAFPIMREFGFVGVNYLVSKYVGAEGYMSVEQINELGVAGWEIGSHSISHADLTTFEHPEWEIIQSQERLAKMFDWPINTFAYPFGKETYDIRIMVSRNYIAGMGLGVTVKQRPGILYYLSRRPVPLHTTIETFGTYLPWNTPPGQ